MSVESAKAKLDAQPGDPATGYISKADHQDSYTELVDDTALTGATTAEALTISGNLNGRDPDNLVAGPGSSTDNALVRFDGTGGKTVQGSGITVDDSGKVTFGSVDASAGLELGSSGPRIMSGTGSPEGVVTAPVGSVWTDTAATTGAIRWVKASGASSTGWVVEYGDTGMRAIAKWDAAGTITGSMPAGLVVTTGSAGYVSIRRVNNLVSVRWFGCKISNASAAHITFPAGFAPAATSLGAYGLSESMIVVRSGVVTPAVITPQANGGLDWWIGSQVDDYPFGGVSVFTNDQWPASLPGSAA